MKTGPSGFLSLYSCSAAGFDSASGANHDDEAADEEEERVVIVQADEDDEDADGAFGPSLFPDRWDVLGLGQAMVIPDAISSPSPFFPVFTKTFLLLYWFYFS